MVGEAHLALLCRDVTEAKHLSREFDPFDTTKSDGLRSGLGLRAAHGIITQQHSGRVHVERAPAQGRSSHLHFPVAGKEFLEEEALG